MPRGSFGVADVLLDFDVAGEFRVQREDLRLVGGCIGRLVDQILQFRDLAEQLVDPVGILEIEDRGPIEQVLDVESRQANHELPPIVMNMQYILDSARN
jgi:hypothetical protein